MSTKNDIAQGQAVTSPPSQSDDETLKPTSPNQRHRLRWLNRALLSFAGKPFITYDRRAIGTTYVKLQVGAAGVLLVDDLTDRLVGLSEREYQLLQSLAYDQTLRHLIVSQIGGAPYRNHQPNKPVISITRVFLLVNTALLTSKRSQTLVQQSGLSSIRGDVLYCLSILWLLVFNVYRNLLATDEHVLIAREHPKHELSLHDLVTGYLRNSVCHALATNAKLAASATGFLQVGAFNDDVGHLFRSLFTAIDGVLEHRLAFEKYIALVRLCLKLERIPAELQNDKILDWMLSDITFVMIALDDAYRNALPGPILRTSMRLNYAHDALLKLFSLPGIFVERVPFDNYKRLHHLLCKNETRNQAGVNAGIFAVKALGEPVTDTPAFTTIQVDGLLKPTIKTDASAAVSDLRATVVNLFGVKTQMAAWQDTRVKGPTIRIRMNLPAETIQALGLGAATAFMVLSNNRQLRGYTVPRDAMLPAVMASTTTVTTYVRVGTTSMLGTPGTESAELMAFKWLLCGRRDEGGNFLCPNLWVSMLLGTTPGPGAPLEATEDAPSTLVTRDTLIRPGNIVVTDIESQVPFRVEIAFSPYSMNVQAFEVQVPLAYALGVSIAIGLANRRQYILRRLDVYASLEQGIWLHALQLASIPTENDGMTIFMSKKENQEAMAKKYLSPAFIELAAEFARFMQQAGFLSALPIEHEGTLTLAAAVAGLVGYLIGVEGQDPWLVEKGLFRREFSSSLSLIARAAEAVDLAV